jgi:hypothetical protein
VKSEAELVDILQRLNKAKCRPPLPAKEVKRVGTSVWEYESSGSNWVGSRGVLQITRQDFDALKSPAALWLLAVLRFAHGSRSGAFAISAKAMARVDAARGLGAALIRESAAELVAAGFLDRVHRGGKGKGDVSKFNLSATPKKS